MNLSKLAAGMQLFAGDVIGTTDWNPIAFALRWRQAGPGEAFRHRVASHVGIVIDSQPIIIEAVSPRVRRAGPGRVGGDVVFVWRPRILELTKALNFSRGQIGTPYDFPALAAEYGWGKQDRRRYYCSELVAATLAKGGYALPAEWKIKVEPFDMQLHGEGGQEIVYRSYKPWW
jgi:uncharacterized protein YycO